MPKLRENPIGPADLEEYLKSESDFSFELRVLRMLRARGLECEHGGLYEDPVTKKSREFDIRVVARINGYCVRLAIECKNVREYFPLLISCVPRHPDESYHEVAIIAEPRTTAAPRAQVVRVRGNDSCYRPLSAVGKSLVQVGRMADKEETLYTSEEGIFEKWAQSLASADELVERSYWEKSNTLATVIPVVVVPDGRLWTVEYNSDGEQSNEPTLTDHCSFFVDKAYSMEAAFGPTLHISHLELMTTGGLSAFMDDSLSSEEAMQTFFPHHAIEDTLNADE